jgi:translation initiation factor SUI1
MDRLLSANDEINALFTEEVTTHAGKVIDRSGKIHIRTQQQGRRWLTTIEGLDEDLDQERIARAMKKAFHCAAKMNKTDEGTEIIVIQGNHRDDALAWLLENEVITEKERKERVVLHGV